MTFEEYKRKVAWIIKNSPASADKNNGLKLLLDEIREVWFEYVNSEEKVVDNVK